MNVFEIFSKKKYEDFTVLFDGEKTFTQKELKSLILPIYKRLLEENEQNVLITSKNNFDFVIHFLSAAFAKKDIYLLSDSKKISNLDFEYIRLDELQIEEIEKSLDFVDENAFAFEKPDLKTAFVTLFTSGSTGTPKKIKKSIENILIEAKDVIDHITPMIKEPKRRKVSTSSTAHHMFGLTCWLFLPLCDCGNFLINTKEVIYPDRAELKDTVFVSTPSFLETFGKYDVQIDEKPELVLTAGDKLKKETFGYFSSYNVPVLEIYGSTETGIIAFKTNYDDEYFHCFKSVEIETDRHSQITVKSPYFQEEQAVLCDIIEIKDSSNFRLKNRNDRIVKIQEKRVNTTEIENDLNKTEWIETSFCFKHGEKLSCAAVLSQQGKNFYLGENGKGRQNLIKALKNSLKDKTEVVPQKWRFLPEIPKTKTGKIDKEKINEIFDTNISLPLVLDFKKNETEAEYEIVFSKSSNFFEGHFKDFPILPGVVQLYFAHKFASEAFDKTVLENTVKKVKFSHLIRPDENLKLSLKLINNTISYTYSYGTQVCSSGVFSIKE